MGLLKWQIQEARFIEFESPGMKLRGWKFFYFLHYFDDLIGSKAMIDSILSVNELYNPEFNSKVQSIYQFIRYSIGSLDFRLCQQKPIAQISYIF